MSAPGCHRESKVLDGLTRSAPISTAFKLSKGINDALARMKLLRTWYAAATLFAVIAACVSITSPVRSHTQVVWTLTPFGEVDVLELSSSESPSDSPVARSTHPDHPGHNHQALESECDDRDVDFEAAAVVNFSVAFAPVLRVLQQAQYTGSVITPAHLRISSDFPRGPPATS